VQYPVNGLPWRNANTASPPGAGGSRQDPEKAHEMWRGSSPPYREMGVDARRHHAIVVVDGQGKITEDWTQWDTMFKRPHAIYISPYDAQKHVWVVDDHTHAIYKFTNDGKKHVQTIGTPNVPGADGTHFNRPTYMAWLPDGTFYVSDGYNGTRVAKFDASGKFLGGLILPGHGIMLRALESGTAGLHVPTGEVRDFPTNTSDALTSGGTFAIAGAVQRMVENITRHCGETPECIMTGGAGWKMAPSMSVKFELVDSLIFDGLLEIASRRFAP
jgi:hypothetical protein